MVQSGRQLQRAIRRPGDPLPAGHQLRLAIQRMVGNLINRYTAGYKDQNNVAAQYTQQGSATISVRSVRHVARLQGSDACTAGILNLFDKDPPFTNQVARFQARGYDDRFHNPLGRVFQLAASYQF